jgi:diacylglycerol kinase family enzyme
MAIRINDFMCGMFAAIGIRLIDFKLEFGRIWDGDFSRTILADEISPDGCRLWDIATGEKLDKDRFRRDLGGEEQAYQEVARRLGLLQDDAATPGEVPLCIAPAGTINLVARELGYARDPERLAAQVCAAWECGPASWTRAPLYTLGDMPVVACLSIGPDSHAVARVSGALKRRIGRLAYAVAMLQVMRNWPREKMGITGELADGTPFACQAAAAIVSHGALFAGPFRLSPSASLTADAVELIVLERPSRRRVAAFTAAAFGGWPLDRLGLATFRTARRITFDRCVSPVQVDGDHMPDCADTIGPSGMALQYVV